MSIKKFIIEVEEGYTNCEKCPLIHMKGIGSCWVTDLVQCNDYNLTTMKIKEYYEPNCYNLQCLNRNPNKKLEEENEQNKEAPSNGSEKSE